MNKQIQLISWNGQVFTPFPAMKDNSCLNTTFFLVDLLHGSLRVFDIESALNGVTDGDFDLPMMDTLWYI